MTEPDPPIPILTALIVLAQVQLAEAWAEVRDQNTYALALAVAGLFATTAVYSTLLLV